MLQTESYDDASTFTHTSAAIVAASMTAVPPVSVRMNSRRGVSRLRAQAVRPLNGVCGCAEFTTRIVASGGRRQLGRKIAFVVTAP